MAEEVAWLSLAVIALNFAALVANVVMTWVQWRRWRHALALDVLLGNLCVAAFARDHVPVWQAWTQTMGTISVEVSGKRKLPE